MLDIKSYIPQAKMILVTTPHPSASHVAIKAGYAAQKLEHEILGVVENMSYFYNEANGKNEKILKIKDAGEVEDYWSAREADYVKWFYDNIHPLTGRDPGAL